MRRSSISAAGRRSAFRCSPAPKGRRSPTLRRRLAAEDDSLTDTGKQSWDADLTAAVKRFQFRMGLKQTGVVAGATLRELDVPAATRFRQLASSAQRLAGVDFPFGPRYIVVNIPSTAVDAVENDRVVRRYAAIVGDPEHHSPEVQAKVVAVNINPTWTVPVSIIKNEIAPKMLKDPSYLDALAHSRAQQARRGGRSAFDQLGERTRDAITRCGRIPARRIRWARSASQCPIRIRSICTTRRRAICSRAIIASCRMAACACRA